MPLITDPTSPFAITAALAAAALLVMQARGGGSAVARALVPVRVRRTLKNYRSLRRRRLFQMAQAVADGARGVNGADVRLRRVAELAEAKQKLSAQEAYRKAQELQKEVPEATHDDLRWADGICWGTPTRYGNMAAQMKQFIDSTGSLWMKGELEDKPAGIFVSTGTIHGGQETTVITSLIPLMHLGMLIVGTPYGQNPQILVTDGIGGSPYGPGTLAGGDGSRQPVDSELTTARNLGIRVARVAERVKDLRKKQL